MKRMLSFASRWIFLGFLVTAGIWFSASPADAQAGSNAVYNSSGNCSTSSPCTPSTAFIDASAVTQHADLCDTIYRSILSPPTYPAAGAVIDARGVGGSALACTHGTPWFESGTGYVNKPATILLPAATITIAKTWILPNNTHLIGEATNAPGSTGNLQTTIQTSSSSFTGAMIQFGDSNCPTTGCTGISVEQVTLHGSLATANGIVNQNSGPQSYVDHVNMYQLLGTGLLVSGSGAYDSGPYNNITFNVAGTPNSSTVCVQILNAGKTRGIHGLTCISGTIAA